MMHLLKWPGLNYLSLPFLETKYELCRTLIWLGISCTAYSLPDAHTEPLSLLTKIRKPHQQQQQKTLQCILHIALFYGIKVLLKRRQKSGVIWGISGLRKEEYRCIMNLTSAQNIWDFFRVKFSKVSWSLLEHCSTAKSLSCILSAKKIYSQFSHILLWIPGPKRERKRGSTTKFFPRRKDGNIVLQYLKTCAPKCQTENRSEKAHTYQFWKWFFFFFLFFKYLSLWRYSYCIHINFQLSKQN